MVGRNCRNETRVVFTSNPRPSSSPDTWGSSRRRVIHTLKLPRTCFPWIYFLRISTVEQTIPACIWVFSRHTEASAKHCLEPTHARLQYALLVLERLRLKTGNMCGHLIIFPRSFLTLTCISFLFSFSLPTPQSGHFLIFENIIEPLKRSGSSCSDTSLLVTRREQKRKEEKEK